MCLGIPMKVACVSGNTAVVEMGALSREVDVRFLDEVSRGDYVIVHAGFAIQKVDESEARKTLELVEEMGRGGL